MGIHGSLTPSQRRQCLDSGTSYTKVNAVIVQILPPPANLDRIEGNKWMVASLGFSGKASITLDSILHGHLRAYSLTEARSLGQAFKAQRRKGASVSPPLSSEENKSFQYVARYSRKNNNTESRVGDVA